MSGTAYILLFLLIKQKDTHEVINRLEGYLSEITGFAATSLQPNSGAQGEYSGLMVIKSYLEKKVIVTETYANLHLLHMELILHQQLWLD